LTNSFRSEKSIGRKLNRTTKSASRSNSKNKNSFGNAFENFPEDNVLKYINKIKNILHASENGKKVLTKVNRNKILDELDNLIDVYISNTNNIKVNNTKSEEKEFILKTKCETTEKMIRDYELKFLSAEKDKAKLKKQVEELNFKLEELKEREMFVNKELDNASAIEQNNKILIKQNENLNRELFEMKNYQEIICKRFEEELNLVQEKMDKYRILLNKINSGYVFNNKN
jgi:hypothetical protein